MSEELTRNIDDITNEIQVLKTEAQYMAVRYICEIGKKLTEAKAMLPRGEWAEWLQDKVEFSQRTATDFMRIYKEYGSDQISLFGGNSQAIANLGYTKALQLLAIPAAERESFVEENNVDELSTRQIDELIKERNEALKKAEETERLQEQLDIAEARAKKSESDRAFAAEKLKTALDEKAQIEAKLQKEKDKLKRLKDNPTVPDELKEKLKSEAEEAAKKEYEKRARELDERITQAQAFADAANADKEKAEAKAAELRKKLSMSNTTVTEFKTQFEQVQSWANKCITTIDKLKTEDTETAVKLTAAMTAFLTQMLDKVKEGQQ